MQIVENQQKVTSLSNKVPRPDPIEDAKRMATPSWPLQNTVAVNPFWNFREQSFEEVMAELPSVLHESLYMPLSFFRDCFRDGTITESALRESLLQGRTRWPELPESVTELLRLSQGDSSITNEIYTLAESNPNQESLDQEIIQDFGKYAAAYFDDQQALARLPWQDLGFWEAWLEAQRHDATMRLSGINDFNLTVSKLRALGARSAIDFILAEMGIDVPDARSLYLRRLVATVLGWATQFKYVEWQQGLGYASLRSAIPVEMIAVRLAYEYGLFEHLQRAHPAVVVEWQESMKRRSAEGGQGLGDSMIAAVWQSAYERSYQRKVASLLNETQSPSLANAVSAQPQAQMLFCIDVRSEMIRRHIENVSSSTQTLGFAGFFGLAFDYQRLGEKAPGHRLPVLLKSGFAVGEQSKASCETEGRRRLTQDASLSFFRNLRKAPLSSFLFVELFGGLYVAKMVRTSILSLKKRVGFRETPLRFDSSTFEPVTRFIDPVWSERAEAVLRHSGLINNAFAPLVLIVGHGSHTTNNLFGSALDCGACGGHSGDINARFLARLLNDRQVRSGLAERGIVIPAATWFQPAVHETVTDEIHLLDEELIPPFVEILKTRQILDQASAGTRKERRDSRSAVLDDNPERRAHNWSEVRPEWGLAGNACFIVAPRSRSRGTNLGSRSFLHDYDWQKDNGFKTLELIMTAPMIVTNWINLQYYASTVAPGIYGSGNKTLHNLTNETGVVEGNGGDLRVGLPLQSVHDGNRFVHDPLRLSVFIEAPIAEIERIVAQHPSVRDLVDNGWLHLLCLDPKDARVKRRFSGGKYELVQTK